MSDCNLDKVCHESEILHQKFVEVLGTGLTASWTKFVTKANSSVRQHGISEVEIVESSTAKRLLVVKMSEMSA